MKQTILSSEPIDLGEQEDYLTEILTHENPLFCWADVINQQLTIWLDDSQQSIANFLKSASKLERLIVCVKLIDYYQEFPTYYQGVWTPENIVIDTTYQVKMGKYGIRHLLAGHVDEGDFNRLLMVVYVGNQTAAFLPFLNREQDDCYELIRKKEAYEHIRVKLVYKIEELKKNRRDKLVSINRIMLKCLVIALGTLLLTICLAIAYLFHIQTETIPRLQADIAGQEAYISGSHHLTVEALAAYPISDLSMVEKRLLAKAYVRLESLSDKQKLAIGNDLSETSPERLLDYWVAIGRGQFQNGLDLAQQLDDPQLELYAYTKLFAEAQLSKSLGGQEKQERLKVYEERMATLMAMIKEEQKRDNQGGGSK
jgi:uncharacterized membrane protein YukC